MLKDPVKIIHHEYKSIALLAQLSGDLPDASSLRRLTVHRIPVQPNSLFFDPLAETYGHVAEKILLHLGPVTVDQNNNDAGLILETGSAPSGHLLVQQWPLFGCKVVEQARLTDILGVQRPRNWQAAGANTPWTISRSCRSRPKKFSVTGAMILLCWA